MCIRSVCAGWVSWVGSGWGKLRVVDDWFGVGEVITRGWR
jgi:hypothetical protein